MCINPRVLILRNERGVKDELRKIGVSQQALKILAPKAFHYLIKLEGIPSPIANLLKQEMVSVMADAAISKKMTSFTSKKSDVLLIGTEAQLKKLLRRLNRQRFNLPGVSRKLSELIKNFKRERFVLSFKEKKMDLARKVAVMGILNLTPDSFYNGGKYAAESRALKRAEEMLKEGADLIDIGGESTRPGAKEVRVEEEIRRVIPVISKIRDLFEVPLSIDTYKAKVAKEALEAGVDMVNDISGLRFDPQLKEIVARFRAGVVLMHIKGTPRDMQNSPQYGSLMGEIISYLSESIRLAQTTGIDLEKIAVDPGIGFGKTVEHNLQILNHLGELRSLGRPILIGASRKSFIGAILGLPLEERLEGSLAAASLAVMQGAKIIRTHDVKPTRRAVDLTQAIIQS
ncbi:MAG: dihydropteroate synthase [bacterium]